ncbi:MAG: lytic transglycosylase domain-containing protein [Acidiferrobacterales bacterium]
MGDARRRSVKTLQLLIAFALLAVAGEGALANSTVYAYRAPDGSWVFTDHALKNHRYRLMRKAEKARGAAARPTMRFHGGDPSAYDRLIRRMAHVYNIDAALIKAVMRAESAFNPHATSRKGASGLMQLMPATASRYGVYDLYDPVENVRAAVKYLKDLMERYDNNTRLVLAAYNAGENAVDEHKGMPPYRETLNYVRKVLLFRKHYKKEFN